MARFDQLYDAIEAGDTRAAVQLLDNEPELVESPGATPPPIHWAIFHDRPSIVDAPVERGADIERRDSDRDATPLAYSIVFGRAHIAQRLVSLGAELKGMHDLAVRGASGEFEHYPDVGSREQFAHLATLIPHA